MNQVLKSQKRKLIINFGRNICFVPKHRYKPQTEGQLLELLNLHASNKIRVVASLHSWSNAVKCEDVILNMNNFDTVEIVKNSYGETHVTVGGGCTIQKLLNVIHSKTDLTLPTIGAIKRQTIAGAISTGTHGSGKHSLSHYVKEIKIAAYDLKTGKARIYKWNNGTEIQAARCALGCMGVILSVTFQCVPKYYVKEIVSRYNSLEEVINQEQKFPLQEFVLIPYLWSYFVYKRQETFKREIKLQKRIRSLLYRAYNLIAVDILFHFLIKGMLLTRNSNIIRVFYQQLCHRLILQNCYFIDNSECVLCREHHLFNHLEMEIFIPAANLFETVEFIQSVIMIFAGTSEAIPKNISVRLSKVKMLETLISYKASYTHHYPLFFRRVLPDNTLISMTSCSDEPYYTVSFFTYLKKRERFCEFARFLARSLSQLYGVRLHWGKYYPLENSEIKHLYPNIDKFRQICENTDPKQVFHNDYVKSKLGM